MTDIAQRWCGDDDSFNFTYIFSLIEQERLSDSIKLVELSCLSVSTTRLGRLLSIIIREFRSCEKTKEFNTKLNNFLRNMHSRWLNSNSARRGAATCCTFQRSTATWRKSNFFAMMHTLHFVCRVSLLRSKINKRETENEKKKNKELQLGRSYTHEKSVGLCHVLGNSNDRLCVA